MNLRLLAKYRQEMCLTARSHTDLFNTYAYLMKLMFMQIKIDFLHLYISMDINIELWCFTEMCLLVGFLFECSCMMVLIVAASDGPILTFK
jgi:hypothetical protein